MVLKLVGLVTMTLNQLNQTNKGEDCYDASIFLKTNIQKAKDISRKVVIAGNLF